MFKIIYPIEDTTIYSQYPELNTGHDAILELTKIPSGSPIVPIIGRDFEYYPETYISRILLKFELDSVFQSITSGDISNYKVFLVLKSADSYGLERKYAIDVHPVSSSWEGGVGYFNLDYGTYEGASWKYRNGKTDGAIWTNSGGDYYSNYSVQQSFFNESPDVRVDITSIFDAWVSGSISNDGVIVKFSATDEESNANLGHVRFFSRETHTIYLPRLEIIWDDSDISLSGSIEELTDDFVVYARNLRDAYFVGEVVRIKLGVRPRFTSAKLSQGPLQLMRYRLPVESYFQIMDSATDEVIIPFSEGTRLSIDEDGNYIDVDFSSLLPEREYHIVLKILNGKLVKYIDTNLHFKVRRV